MLTSECHHRVEIVADSLKPLEITCDEFLCFSVLDAELKGKGTRPLSVDRGEVDCLGPTPHVARYFGNRNIEDHRCCLAVNVTTRLKRFDKGWIVREVCE